MKVRDRLGAQGMQTILNICAAAHAQQSRMQSLGLHQYSQSFLRQRRRRRQTWRETIKLGCNFF